MKETDSIKERLNDYVNLRNHIDNQTNRLEAITMIGCADRREKKEKRIFICKVVK
jgi:hypothetical protein